MSVAGGNIAGASMLFAPLTFGLSLIPGAVLTTVSAVGIIDNAENNAILNNNKEKVCLQNEIRDTNNQLGKKSDYETEEYEEQHLQEVPPKEYCKIM